MTSAVLSVAPSFLVSCAASRSTRQSVWKTNVPGVATELQQNKVQCCRLRVNASVQAEVDVVKAAMDVSLPEGLVLRTLEVEDYKKGYVELLSQLTVTGTISEEAFQARYQELQKRGEDYHIAVVEDVSLGRVVATGTLLVEYKILRQCGKVGHIEDVVVDASQRSRQLGKTILAQLSNRAKEAGCYKVILDCSDSNVPFYEKCGFKRKEIQMALYFVE